MSYLQNGNVGYHNINFNNEGLDEAIKKANQLVELLREAEKIMNAIFGERRNQND